MAFKHASEFKLCSFILTETTEMTRRRIVTSFSVLAIVATALRAGIIDQVPFVHQQRESKHRAPIKHPLLKKKREKSQRPCSAGCSCGHISASWPCFGGPGEDNKSSQEEKEVEEE